MIAGFAEPSAMSASPVVIAYDMHQMYSLLPNNVFFFKRCYNTFILYLSLKILRYSIYGIVFCSLMMGIVLYKKYITDTAIPGWASSLIFIITSIILQLFSVTLIVLLMELSSRKNINAPNSKIYLDFIENKEVLILNEYLKKWN